LALVAGGGLAWAIWYDNYRRTRPDYKSKLVKKRRRQLIEKRRLADPTYYVKEIELLEDIQNPQAAQMYMMKHIQEGEQMLERGQIRQGAAHISMGLAYLPDQQLRMVLGQLAQGLPSDQLKAIQETLPVARGRAQTQQLEKLLGRTNATMPKRPTDDGPIIREASEEHYEPSISDGSPEDVVEMDMETEFEAELNDDEHENDADETRLPDTTVDESNDEVVEGEEEEPLQVLEENSESGIGNISPPLQKKPIERSTDIAAGDNEISDELD